MGLRPVYSQCHAALWIVVLVDYPVIVAAESIEDARPRPRARGIPSRRPSGRRARRPCLFVWLAAQIFGPLPAEGPQLVEIVSVRRADVCGGQPAQRIPPGAVEDVARVDLDAIEARPAEAGIIEIGFGVAAILREAGAAEDTAVMGRAP
ncbi:MAG: hypothetical protein KatS3mg038_2307 [Candidatus Kapaibacterium sp.]|nr:MAG: hypothetical protein KatS3mg038_2307 [Candidatus Kapabacteria bacterium]